MTVGPAGIIGPWPQDVRERFEQSGISVMGAVT